MSGNGRRLSTYWLYDGMTFNYKCECFRHFSLAFLCRPIPFFQLSCSLLNVRSLLTSVPNKTVHIRPNSELKPQYLNSIVQPQSIHPANCDPGDCQSCLLPATGLSNNVMYDINFRCPNMTSAVFAVARCPSVRPSR